MKKLLFLPLFSALLLGQSALGMESAPKKPRTDAEGKQEEITIEHRINWGISDMNPSEMGALLSSDLCKALSYEQKTELYKLAVEQSSRIKQICELGAPLVARTGDERIKKRFSHEEDLEAAKKIETLMNVWRHLKRLRFPHALFNPRPYQSGPRITLDNALEAFILAEQEQISGCCFHLTLYNIANALIAKKNSGVIAELITNQTQGDNPCLQALELITSNGITISCPKNKKTWETNHHKFFVFKRNVLDKPLVWTGSYNVTGHSNENSWENVVVLDDTEVIDDYMQEFAIINSASKVISLQELQAIQPNPSEYALAQNNVPVESRKRIAPGQPMPPILKSSAQQPSTHPLLPPSAIKPSAPQPAIIKQPVLPPVRTITPTGLLPRGPVSQPSPPK